MNRLTTSLRLLLLALICAPLCALLACGDPENLSVGEVRCEGVSCEPIPVEHLDSEGYPADAIEREEVLVPSMGPAFCPAAEIMRDSLQDAPDAARCVNEAMVAIGDDRFIVATGYFIPSDSNLITAGIRLAGYTHGELTWESTELSRQAELGNFSDAGWALAPAEAPGEAVLGLTRGTGTTADDGYQVYEIKEDGELNELFEDEAGGRISGLAALEGDLIILSKRELRYELTRYTRDGEIVWRQTTLAMGGEWNQGQTASDTPALRVIDRERIVVLVPRASAFQLVEVSTDGELVLSWMNSGPIFPDGSTIGARLAAGPDGQFVVGMDGYDVRRGWIDDEAPVLEWTAKERTRYYRPDVLGLHVDSAGYIYIATIDGNNWEGYAVLDRITPDLSRRESFLIEGPGDEVSRDLMVRGDLVVSDDQRTLYFATGGALATIELPPIDDEQGASLGD
jgi:hypothetical protein